MRVKESGCASDVNRPPAEQGGGRPGFSPPPRESTCVLVYLLFCLALLSGLPTGAVAQSPTVTLSVSSSTVNEGGTVTLTATLSQVHTSDLDIPLQLVDDGSTAETDDYCGIPSITIPAGQATGSAEFRTRVDTDSDDEMIILAIPDTGRPSGYVLGNPDGVTITITETTTILPEDPEVSFGTPVETVGEEAGTHPIYIDLNTPPTCDLMIKYSVGGTATFGVDYRMDARFSVPPGMTSHPTLVEITDDMIKDEGEETVRIILTSGDGYTVVMPSIYTLTIRDTCRLSAEDDPPITVSLSVSPAQVPEGEKATITATLSRCLPYPTTIPLHIADGGTAEADDYGGVGSILIPAGEATGSVEVQTNPDPDNDPETLVIAIPEGQLQYDITTLTPNVTVFINDTTLPEVSFEHSSSDYMEGPGTYNVNIILSPSPAARLKLRYRDDGTGTAVSGTDYDSITDSGGITVEATDMSEEEFWETIPVTLTAGDDEDGGPKTVVLALAEGNGYVLGSVNKHTLIITDKDPPPPGTPEVSISGGTSVTEGETAIFTLTASEVPLNNNINVNVEVIGSSFAASGKRTVTVGTDGEGTLEVETRDDDEDESDDKVTAFVTAGTGYSPADGSRSVSSVTVRDNDEPPPPGTTQPVVMPPPTVTPRPAPPPAPQTNPDRAALLEIYKATGGENWENSEDWNTSASIDDWYGVAADGEDRVTGLYLDDNGLSGEFPVSELATMTKLREIALWGNEDLRGAPDDEKTDRAALWVFYEGNDESIAGWFPQDETDYFSYSGWEGVTVNDSGRVTELDLSDLGLSGETGSELGALSSLEKLDLSGNPDLEGELPAEFMSLSELTYLDISGTQVACPPDDEFRMWLRDLMFSGNDACEVPAEGTQGGGGGCAVASDAEGGVFQLVLAVFVLLAAGGGRIGRR